MKCTLLGLKIRMPFESSKKPLKIKKDGQVFFAPRHKHKTYKASILILVHHMYIIVKYTWPVELHEMLIYMMLLYICWNVHTATSNYYQKNKAACLRKLVIFVQGYIVTGTRQAQNISYTELWSVCFEHQTSIKYSNKIRYDITQSLCQPF
jgi:hypothetical protein